MSVAGLLLSAAVLGEAITPRKAAGIAAVLRGRLVREHEWDDQGHVVRDDEVDEDGSRKRS